MKLLTGIYFEKTITILSVIALVITGGIFIYRAAMVEKLSKITPIDVAFVEDRIFVDIRILFPYIDNYSSSDSIGCEIRNLKSEIVNEWYTNAHKVSPYKNNFSVKGFTDVFFKYHILELKSGSYTVHSFVERGGIKVYLEDVVLNLNLENDPPSNNPESVQYDFTGTRNRILVLTGGNIDDVRLINPGYDEITVRFTNR